MNMKYIKTLLIVSLLLNIFFLGLTAGHFIHKKSRRGPFRSEAFVNFVGKDFIKSQRRHIRRRQRAFNRALEEKPFDRKKVHKAFLEVEKNRALFRIHIKKKILENKK